ncbi:MAG: hypothetical protein JWM41_4918 [Gemmatimonadetes bacterium]|nr:hypothetical protein [Gemmatimonadota bacterium]
MKLAPPLLSISLAAGLLYAAACASTSTSASSSSNMSAPDMSMSPPSPDPRVGLRAGSMVKWSKDTTKKTLATRAAEASWNMRLLSNTPPNETFMGVTHSDLAFKGPYAIQGNYDGYQIFDISNPRKPSLYDEYVCRGSQSDVSVYQNLIFVSGEATSGRLDCGLQGIQDSISKERFRGIRIFDATDLKHPKYIASVQTCRGSHTHTVVEDPNDKNNVYVYISGSSGVRPAAELAGCVDLAPDQDPNGEQFRIEVIQVPLAHPEQAHVITKPGILTDLAPAPRNNSRTAQDSIDRAAQAAARGGAGGRGGPPGGGRGRGNAPPRGPVQCHDITVYPAVGLAGGACGGYGLLLDISDVKNPKRLYAAADSNMSFWHSATFSNDGSKVLFSDEWGGGSAPRCRSTDKYEWGADALFTIVNKQTVFQSYYKMPAAQTQFENCVAHNGSLIPIPGREVMVQAWYQGGLSIFDWSNTAHPKEIAFFDRGPIDTITVGASAGSWSAYWYNGVIVSSEIGRGLDIFEITPSAFISQNEIDAAKTVHFDYLNVQGQQKMVWPASFSLSRAYLDQLARNNGQTPDKIAAARTGLANAEKLSGQARKDALAALATQLHTDAQGAADAPRAHKLAFSVGDLAKM